MRQYAPLALAVLILLSGCGGLPGGGSTATPSTATAPETPTSESTPTTTTTPTTTDTTTTESTPTATTTATTTTTTTATPTDESVTDDFAAGVSSSGIENVTALLDAHRQTLLSEGFAVTSNITQPGRNATLSARYTPNGTRVHLTRVTSIGSTPSTTTAWLNDTVELIRTSQGNETRYRYMSVQAPESYVASTTGMRTLEQLLVDGNYSVVRTNDTRAVFVATAFDNATRNDFTAERVRLAVSSDGYIRSANVTGHVSTNASITMQYNVTRVGVTSLDRPVWTETAPEPFDGRPVVEFENCTRPYVNLTVSGNDTLSAGTQVTLAVDDQPQTATLSEDLAPDESQYVYRTRNGTLAVSTEIPPFDDRGALPNETQVQVVTDDHLLVLQGSFGFSCGSASSDDGESS